MRNSILPNPECVNWCIEQHANTNHYYDKYLPYEFHLRMVAQVADQFIRLIKTDTGTAINFRNAVKKACWGHDLIEDCRVSYNDVKSKLGEEAADIIYAVTNEKGKSRKERANDKYYEGIRNTPGAVFVKLCDRIANVQYSKMTKSRMYEVYQKELDEFIVKLGWDDSNTHPYFEMFAYLKDLFRD